MTKKHPLHWLRLAIDEYKVGRTSFDTDELVDIRDKIALSLSNLVDFYSETRSASEAAEYQRKKFEAEHSEKLRQTIEETKKRLTRDQIKDRVLIASSALRLDEIEAYKEYYKVRMAWEAATQILHSISSRINNIKQHG